MTIALFNHLPEQRDFYFPLFLKLYSYGTLLPTDVTTANSITSSKVCQEFNFQSHSQPQKQCLDNHNSTIFSSMLFKLGQ